MICSDNLIAKSDIGLLAQEQRTIVCQAFQKVARILGEYLYVFTGDTISLSDHLFQRIDEDYFAVTLPRFPGDRCCFEHAELSPDFLQRFFGNPPRIGYHNPRTSLTILPFPQ